MVHLIESNGKKAAFLREAVQVTGVNAKVHQIRAEEFAENCAEPVDVVTARALAPLKTLCDQVFPLIAKGAIGLFPKGQDVEAELTEAAKYWTIQATKVPSVTSPEGQILVVRGLAKRKYSVKPAQNKPKKPRIAKTGQNSTNRARSDDAKSRDPKRPLGQ